MRLDQLKIQNFRCFEQASIAFSPQFNLFVGVNGAGKTSLLQAVAASLATPLHAVSGAVVWIHAQEKNARLALLRMEGRVRYERCYPVRLEAEGVVAGQSRQWWMEESGPGNNQTKFEHTIYSALTDLAASLAQGGAGALPVVAFYTAERRWKLGGTTAEEAVRKQESRLDAYRSWHEAALDVQGLETWVVAKSLEQLEAAAQSQSGADLPSELALVNRAVADAVPGAVGLRYDIKFRRLVLDWHSGDPVPFDTLSDGQRGVVALVADIARRMVLLNPQLGSDVLAQTPGIVVIDELDMHLHPAWQRSLPGVLKATFPQVQFIATSHSPQMMSELMPEEIWLMRGAEVVGHPERSMGLSTNQVLEELMGTDARNAGVAAEIQAIRTSLDADDISQAKALLDVLHDAVGDIPEVLELQATIQSLAWLEDGEA